MMLGGLPDFKQFQKKIEGIEETDIAADHEKIKADQKWMKWAIILLIAYILYKETK